MSVIQTRSVSAKLFNTDCCRGPWAHSLRAKSKYSHSEGSAVSPYMALTSPLPHWPSLLGNLPQRYPGKPSLITSQSSHSSLASFPKLYRLSMLTPCLYLCSRCVPILPNSQKVSWGQDPNPIFPLLLFSYLAELGWRKGSQEAMEETKRCFSDPWKHFS